MKNYMLKAFIGLVFMTSCSKSLEDPELSTGLEERGNDNHRNWNLAQFENQYTYTLSDGAQGEGSINLNYTYSCVRPFGRAVASTDIRQEDGVVLSDNSRTISYNDNFKVSVEHAQEYGDEVVRTFHYDSDGTWTGITTEVNGEILDEEIEIGHGGQVKSYTSGGVRTEFTWKANNVRMFKYYIQPSADLIAVENSLAFNQSGVNALVRKATKQNIIKSFNELRSLRKTSSPLRSKNIDEWILVGIEEQNYDFNVIEPYSSPAKGYPGTTSDAGYYYLAKNYPTSWRGFRVEPDGTPISEYYHFKANSYSVKNNLPVNVNYTYDIFGIYDDSDGNPVDYHEQGVHHYEYISGCNQ